ncbi:hypothetical protein [Psychrobacter namhaensis]|uniref:RipA family octameric membrane protein n=1 Tax=Psychrobacter namhaensis TaxID=292734 RepID=UPI003D0377E3
MANNFNSEQLVEHAWKYFILHSTQRMTLFNYFLFIMAALGAGIGAILQASDKLEYTGIYLSFLVVIVSIIFWKLDQRTSFLIKRSENVLIDLEARSGNGIEIFRNEENNMLDENSNRFLFNKIITYGKIFRFTFCITGTVGVIGIAMFVLKMFDCMPIS